MSKNPIWQEAIIIYLQRVLKLDVGSHSQIQSTVRADLNSEELYAHACPKKRKHVAIFGRAFSVMIETCH